MSALDPPPQGKGSTHEKRTKIPTREPRRRNNRQPLIEKWFINPGEKYPVKQGNCTQNCMYQADGVVDMVARLERKNEGLKLHDNDDKEKGIEHSNLFGVLLITERRGSRSSQGTGTGRETAPRGLPHFLISVISLNPVRDILLNRMANCTRDCIYQSDGVV